MPSFVKVTFYDNFREEDTSHVLLDTLDVDNGIDITVFAEAGTWTFAFWFQNFPGDDGGRIDVGPYFWNVADTVIEADIEAAIAGPHPSWVVSVTKVDGVYQVRFGSGDIGDHPPNAYTSEDIDLSGYFSTVWDEIVYDNVPLVADPGCGTGADPEDVPPGEIAAPGRRGGAVRMPHPCSGAKLN